MLSVPCSLEFGTYIFFAFWVFVMTIYALFFLPETKGVPIEEMAILWRKHWFWSRMTMNAEQRAAFKKGDLVGAGIGADDFNVSCAGLVMQTECMPLAPVLFACGSINAGDRSVNALASLPSDLFSTCLVVPVACCDTCWLVERQAHLSCTCIFAVLPY